MTTARMTLGSIFGTVNDAATTVSSVFSTVTKGVGMANKYVSDAAEKQHTASIVEMHEYKTRLVEDKAKEESERKLKIDEFCSKSKRHAELYESAYDRIAELLAPPETK